ncbi:lipocalin family protein, partial [Nocardia tengchongensis]|uniref:lipocalin family protein n=1 Tax=Nocardia tengchongensis TaxID=2055889 RepID=UPI003694F827
MNPNRPRRLSPTIMVAAAFAIAVAGIGTGAPGSAHADPPAPVPGLDLGRYLGTWYQLAAVPQYFNLACARDTRADYTLDELGDVSVHNSCTTWQGSVNEIRGTATVTDPVTNAQLHVSFPGVPTQDARYGPPNYIVTALGDDYTWALVTDPYRLSGFVLSRTTTLDDAQWHDVAAPSTPAGEKTSGDPTTPRPRGGDREQPH